MISNFWIISSGKRYLIILLAPTTMAYGGTSFVITLPAPITAPSPIVRLFKIVHRAPIQTSLPTRVGLFKI